MHPRHVLPDGPMRSPLGLDSGDPQAFAPLLAVDSTNVYLASLPGTNGNQTPASSGGTGTSANPQGAILFIAKDSFNMPPTTLIQALSFPYAIAVDGIDLYVADWGDEDDAGQRPSGAGRIAKCPVAGCNDMSTLVQDYVSYPQAIPRSTTRTSTGATTDWGRTRRAAAMDESWSERSERPKIVRGHVESGSSAPTSG